MDTLTMSEIVKTDKKRERECPCTNKRETHSLSHTDTNTELYTFTLGKDTHRQRNKREKK